MPGVVIAGRAEEVTGLHVVSFLDDPRLKLGREDCRPRLQPSAIRMIVLHTTKGIPGGRDKRPQDIRPGLGPDARAEERCARYWSGDGRKAGAHLVVDHDGSIACLADLRLTAAYHAGSANESSIGIEIYQGADAELYVGQLEATVALVDWLTRRFGVQRQIPRGYSGAPVERLAEHPQSWTGVCGHRDLSANRGAGDPGDAIMEMLGAAGYETFDLRALEDLSTWRARQRELGIPADGVPGPVTARALAARGRASGMYVLRPGD